MDEERYTYNPGTGYPQGDLNNNPYSISAPVKQKKEKKHGGAGRFFKKVMAVICLGALFGGCAAGTFYGITRLTGYTFVAEKKDAENGAIEDRISNIENALKKNTVNSARRVETASIIASDVTDVVEKVMPSMVAVTNQYEAVTNYWGRSYVQENEASGSGIIVGENDTDLFIATNHHVIDSTKSLTVQFVDGSTAEAYVKGSDSNVDIAVIAVKKENLEASTLSQIAVAEMGDSDSLQIGEPAIAIGNALGYGQSVTSGVISAVDRAIEENESSSTSLIQTDAAINPGNSGGALLNLKGQVIGINESKIGGSTIEGIGFAIPINAVKDMIADYSNRETREKVAEAKKGYLGIQGNANYDGSAFGWPEGAYVESVTEGEAAEAAGIYPHDIIVKFDGQEINSFDDLKGLMAYYAAGDTVDIVLKRIVDGEFKEITVTATLGRWPKDS